jgi:hypothetical protein
MSKLIEVEIFWDGDGLYFAHPKDSERLGGPFELLHDAWKQADSEGYRVIRVTTTRGNRGYKRC